MVLTVGLPFGRDRDAIADHSWNRIRFGPGIIAFLADNNIVVLSTFAINLLVTLSMAAGTDYGIFFFGRYQEARQAGEDPRNGLLHHLPRGRSRRLGFRVDDRRSHVVPELHPDAHFPDHRCAVRRGHAHRGRGCAHAGSCSPDHRKSLRTLSTPSARSRIVDGARVGTAIVRWPAPILVTTLAVALIGLVTLPGYKTSYDDRPYLPKDFRPIWGLRQPIAISRNRE